MWYTLRVDTPLKHDWYMPWLLKALEPNRDFLMVAEEVAPKSNKEHIHTMMYISEETHKVLKTKFQNYRARLKVEFPEYYEQNYKDSKKIQTFSLTKVRNFHSAFKYFTKDKSVTYFPTKQEWIERYKTDAEKCKKTIENANKEKIDKWIDENGDYIQDSISYMLGEYHTAYEYGNDDRALKSAIVRIFAKMWTDLGHLEKMKNLTYKCLLEKHYIPTEFYVTVIYRL